MRCEVPAFKQNSPAVDVALYSHDKSANLAGAKFDTLYEVTLRSGQSQSAARMPAGSLDRNVVSGNACYLQGRRSIRLTCRTRSAKDWCRCPDSTQSKGYGGADPRS